MSDVSDNCSDEMNECGSARSRNARDCEAYERSAKGQYRERKKNCDDRYQHHVCGQRQQGCTMEVAGHWQRHAEFDGDTKHNCREKTEGRTSCPERKLA